MKFTRVTKIVNKDKNIKITCTFFTEKCYFVARKPENKFQEFFL